MRAQVFFAFVAQVAAYTDIDVDMFMYKNIDPIVFPGEYSKSHLHTFFGSDAITINTTTSAELQAGCSTAENPNDFSTYCKSLDILVIYFLKGFQQADYDIQGFQLFSTPPMTVIATTPYLSAVSRPTTTWETPPPKWPFPKT